MKTDTPTPQTVTEQTLQRLGIQWGTSEWIRVCNKLERSSGGTPRMNTESKNDVVGVASHALLAVLSSWGDLAHDEKNGFIERFCPKAWILTQVSWNSENMCFVYILDCGQHVSDSVKIAEWLDFLQTNAKSPDAGEKGKANE